VNLSAGATKNFRILRKIFITTFHYVPNPEVYSYGHGYSNYPPDNLNSTWTESRYIDLKPLRPSKLLT
jgi:hypothetical protein